jgi:hypothetical protein
MIKQLWKKFVLKIRLWDTGWNPFFSPSLQHLERMKVFAVNFKRGFFEGMKNAGADSYLEGLPIKDQVVDGRFE